jgi:hypothetical protein
MRLRVIMNRYKPYFIGIHNKTALKKAIDELIEKKEEVYGKI